jgi:hypothetical protein
MSEWTGREISRATEQLECAAAKIIGRILFEFGHLEMELALYLVWENNGSNLEATTDQILEGALHTKLCRLEKRANAKYGSSPSALAEFNRWLKEVHAARAQRNEFVHGRWGVAAVDKQVVNVIGIPTSPKQREIRYSIAQLEESLARLKGLRPQLRSIRSKWPL